MEEISTKLNIYSQRLDKDIEYSIIFNEEYLKIIKPEMMAEYKHLSWSNESGKNDLINILYNESNYPIKRKELPPLFEKIWQDWKKENLNQEDIDKELNHFVERINRIVKKDFERDYCPADKETILERIDIFMETIESRILPTFDNIEREADEIGDKTYKSVSFDDDPSSCFEQAYSSSNRHYEIQNEMRQELLNHYASVLFHLFEKDCEKMKVSLKKINYEKEFTKIDIKFCKNSHFYKINTELKLISNVIKHGKGDSYNKLEKIRVDLFKNNSWILGTSDIEISLEELHQYADAMKGFWKEFFEIKLKPE